MRSFTALCIVSLAGCADEPAQKSPEAPAAPAVDVQSLPPPPSGFVRGQLELSPALRDKVAAGDTVYLIARNAATGGVIAVEKLSANASFPMPFELSGKNVMLPGGSLSGKVRLQARVDKDGDAMSKNPGDVVGEVRELVTVPAENVVLTLDAML